MTRISMNDVSIINPAYGSSKSGARTGVSNFQDILSGQTDAGTVRDDTSPKDISVEPEGQTKVDADKDIQTVTETDRQKESVAVDADVNNDGSEQGEEQQEELNTVISQMLAALQQQIMDTLHISEEEFAGMLDDLSMEAVELLQSGKLSEFVLNAIGAEDSLALLTNENLLQDYRLVMKELGQLLEQGSQELKVSVEELNRLIDAQLARMSEEMPEELLEEMPVAELQQSVAETEEVPVQKTVSQDAVGVTAETTEAAGMTTQSPATGEHVHSDAKGEQNHQPSSQEGPVFTFQNTLQSNANQMVNQVIQETVTNWAPDTQDIMNQIMDYMKILVKPDMSSLEMQLHPASLGTVQVQLEANGDAITARFIAQNDAVRATLESQMMELKQQFQEQGVKVETIEVSVQTQTFGQSFEQGRQAEQAQEENKPRIRRINLNDLEAMDSAQVVEDADRIAVEMMNINGNTVDYMA